uniref:DNA-directed RNA polymerase RBP11-like dimerisation domain-containing protein n=1 Tax=Entomoneis paludosa TaxID=265537 RepID=A0A7S2YI15_9STRA|mmetsp:Transcript_33368/g.69496  ORF Transcript_33368/g.69496 Transcript_33368/m.69496 type:complete len:150 (+) Transcript_33368:105-554(+)|eukprot:CAMPEP_0172441780 /NCGR_PEP_ID=MMETSP1065-20121228/2288_1 /TAXON_ID=265537 /ORGANISM="Amphiprora paludosa, Strain CCMP125" /LENGTH=149 /DNA_ID=CAMNT_0013191315 /DNA_START=64 /DNA_END=513 /DNA_ORIENTATION=+
MSVNEVRLPKAEEDFIIRGTGPPHSRTFCIGDEDHTIGNALRHVLIQNERVGFAGYSVPHPSEPVVQIRVQTVALPNSEDTEPPPATDLLKEACETLSQQCDVVMAKLQAALPRVKKDRDFVERKNMEMARKQAAEEEQQEEGEEMMEE